MLHCGSSTVIMSMLIPRFESYSSILWFRMIKKYLKKTIIIQFYNILNTIPSNNCRWMKNIDPKNKKIFNIFRKAKKIFIFLKKHLVLGLDCKYLWSGFETVHWGPAETPSGDFGSKNGFDFEKNMSDLFGLNGLFYIETVGLYFYFWP